MKPQSQSLVEFLHGVFLDHPERLFSLGDIARICEAEGIQATSKQIQTTLYQLKNGRYSHKLGVLWLEWHRDSTERCPACRGKVNRIGVKKSSKNED